MCLLPFTEAESTAISGMLQQIFGIGSEITDRLARSCLSKSTFEVCKKRLDTIHSSLGPEYGRCLLVKYPHLLAFDIDTMPARIQAFLTDGCSQERASEVILSCPEVLCMDEPTFRAQMLELMRIFPDAGIRRAFLASKARIFLIPREHLRTINPVLEWDSGMADEVWTRITGIHEPVRQAVPVGKAIDQFTLLSERLKGRGIPAETADALAKKTLKYKVPLPFETIGLFLDAGWSPEQLNQLCEIGQRGLQNPSSTFKAEEYLTEAGLPKEEARKCLCSRGPWIKADPEELRATVKTLLELGLTADEVRLAVRKRPYMLGAELHVIKRALSAVYIKFNDQNEPTKAAEPPDQDGNPGPPSTNRVRSAYPMPNSFPPQSAESGPSERTRDWAAKYREIIAGIHPDWSGSRIDNLLKRRTGLLEPFPRGFEALEALHRNVPLPSGLDPRNAAVVWFMELITKPGLNGILEIPADSLEIRIYVIKKVLECSLLRKPSLLLVPFEKVRHPEAPADPEDEYQVRKAFHLRLSELNYRKHEIERRGKKAHLKPYVDMMACETRERFMSRLRKFLNEKQGFVPPKFKPEILRKKSEFG